MSIPGYVYNRPKESSLNLGDVSDSGGTLNFQNHNATYYIMWGNELLGGGPCSPCGW